MEVIPLKQSGKVLLVLIAFTFISSLYCQEDTGTSQAPLLYPSSPDNDTGEATDGTSADIRLTGDEQVADGAVIEALLIT